MYMEIAQVLAALWMIWMGVSMTGTTGYLTTLLYKVLPVVLGIVLAAPTVVKYFI